MVEQAKALLFFIPQDCLFKDVEEGIGEKVKEVVDDPDGQRKGKEDNHAGRERFFHLFDSAETHPFRGGRERCPP